MINLMGTGSNPSEAEGERALPNGPGSQVCSQDTALRVCWASWHLSRAPLEAHPAGEESSGWAGRVAPQETGRNTRNTRGNKHKERGKAAPLTGTPEQCSPVGKFLPFTLQLNPSAREKLER